MSGVFNIGEQHAGRDIISVPSDILSTPRDPLSLVGIYEHLMLLVAAVSVAETTANSDNEVMLQEVRKCLLAASVLIEDALEADT